ncbi:hypothetical protein [Candidatus Hepatoplasma crinochetorum]|uniref:hypothetical protein n=1 Tax=Candidatus Hepatoplasma crinochetorum TaxID=295596 RepID=UPI003084A7BF|nr:MAG: hypothetical protein HCTKY_2420 [Candidatus Hepatoplasma crinochetorum]
MEKENKNNFLNNVKWLISKWWFWVIIVIWFIIFFLSLTKFIPSTNNDWIVWIEFFFSSIIALLSFSIAIIIAKDSKADLEYNTKQTENINKILNSVNQIIKKNKPEIEKTKELSENTNEIINKLFKNSLNFDNKEEINNKSEKEQFEKEINELKNQF